MYFEHPVIYAGMKKALDFVHTLPVFGNAKNIANVAILHHRVSLALDAKAAWPAMHAVEEHLHTAGMPYNVLYSENLLVQSGEYKAIIMPDVTCLNDADAAAIKQYLKNGGKLLVLGDCGLYNEKLRERMEFALGDVLGVSRFKRGNGFTFHAWGAGRCAALPLGGSARIMINNIMQAEPRNFLPAWHDRRTEILNALDELLGADRQIRISAPAHTAVTLRQTESGANAVHFLAYAPPAKTTLEAQVQAGLAREKHAVWHTPEGGAQPLKPANITAGYNTYRLPGFMDYGVLTV